VLLLTVLLYMHVTHREQAPFLADLKVGEEQLAIDNNLYRAPLFKHKPKSTDFLLVCYDDDQECTDYITRELPKVCVRVNMYTCVSVCVMCVCSPV
jgi:hypothetical protein